MKANTILACVQITCLMLAFVGAWQVLGEGLAFIVGGLAGAITCTYIWNQIKKGSE